AVPVPSIYCALIWGGKLYIFMERVLGIQLADAWTRASTDEKEYLVAQLRELYQTLHSRKSPYGDRVCAVNGGPLRDARLNRFGLCGPFQHVGAFESYMWYSTARDGLAKEDMVLTHGDPSMFNVLIHLPSFKVAALVDFTGSGYYPPYWEMVRA
ncbi:hypothetical protein CALCODRAFT_412278, partial [Calocera cornea HHB12733]